MKLHLDDIWTFQEILRMAEGRAKFGPGKPIESAYEVRSKFCGYYCMMNQDILQHYHLREPKKSFDQENLCQRVAKEQRPGRYSPIDLVRSLARSLASLPHPYGGGRTHCVGKHDNLSTWREACRWPACVYKYCGAGGWLGVRVMRVLYAYIYD